MSKKLLIVGLVVLILYLLFLNASTARIIFSNRSTFWKLFALSKYFVIELFELIGWLLQSLYSLLLHAWYGFAGGEPPPYDIREHQELYFLYQQVGKWSGLPWQLFWGLHAEETNLGRNFGSTRVLSALPKNQQTYFYQMCRELHWNPDQVHGSHNGALGHFQFIPETWIRYAVDADGDGRRDPFDLEDAAYSAANYLVKKGGQEDLRKALWHYNQDPKYVNRVMRYLRYS